MAPRSDEDPVVREIPVYISTELASQLYLVQHPLFSTRRTSPDQRGSGLPGEPPGFRLRFLAFS